jgi:hypothetical protein
MGWTIFPLATGLPAVTLAVPAIAPASLHAVLVDVGVRLEMRGAPVRVINDGDITNLWLRELQPAWKQRPVALAGITRSSTLFCLEQLAWIHGMRVAFHAEHVVLPSQKTLHNVQWRDDTLAPIDERVLAAAGAGWSKRIADVFRSYHRTLPITAAGPSCAGLEPAMPPGASLLTSWIIAPV